MAENADDYRPAAFLHGSGAETELALSQPAASGGTSEHGPAEVGRCVRDFVAALDLRDLPGEAEGFESEAEDTLPMVHLRSIRLRRVRAVAACQGMRSTPWTWAISRSRKPDQALIIRRITALFGGGITPSRVSHTAASADPEWQLHRRHRQLVNPRPLDLVVHIARVLVSVAIAVATPC